MYNQIIIQKQSWKLPNKWRIQALPIIINLKKEQKNRQKQMENIQNKCIICEQLFCF